MLRPPTFAQILVAVLFLAIATGGWDNRLAAAALAGALCAAALVLAATPAGRRLLRDGPAPWLAMGCFAAVLAVGVVQWALAAATALPAKTSEGGWAPGAADMFATHVELAKLIGLAAAFTVGLAGGRRESRFDRLLITVTTAGLAYALWAIVIFVGALGGVRAEGVDARLYGGLGSANVAAAVMYVVVIIALRGVLRAFESNAGMPLYERARRIVRGAPISTPALLAAGIALLLTASRGGVAIAAVSVVVLVLWSLAARRSAPSERSGWATRAALAGGLALVALAAFGGALMDRAEDKDLLSDSRFAMYAAHAPVIGERLWLGHGYGAFPVVNEAAMTAESANVLGQIGSLHSAPLQWVEEGGLIGAAAMLGALALVFARIGANALATPAPRSWTRAGVTLFAAVGLHSCFEYVLNVYAVAALLALLLGAWWAYVTTIESAAHAS